ncbi:MAG: hypothetical protein GXP31_14925 [Kiritimatiellaeota bacterium]|nr:hypothetical protein [Kiritimatiellota bacterium]
MLLHISGDALKVTPLEDMFRGLARIRVLRHRQVMPSDNPLAPVVRAWVKDRLGEIISVYAPPETGIGRFSCVGFVDEIYRQSGLDPPFAPGEDDPVRFLLAWYDRKTSKGLAAVISANSALSNPNFRTVRTWKAPRFQLIVSEIADAVIELTVSDLARGFDVRPAPFGSRWRIRILGALGVESPAMGRLDLFRIQYLRLVQRIERALVRQARNGHPLPEASDARRNAIRETYNAVRKDYLYLPVGADPRPLE